MSLAESHHDLFAAEAAAPFVPPVPSGSVRREGERIVLDCPECGLQMTVRACRRAGCAKCGASVPLNDVQRRAAELLAEEMRTRRDAPFHSVVPLTSANSPRPLDVKIAPPPPPRSRAKPAAPPVQASRRPAPPAQVSGRAAPPKAIPLGARNAAEKLGPVRQRIEAARTEGEFRLCLRELFRDSPSWIGSAVVHMAMLILLAFVFIMPQEKRAAEVTLAPIMERSEELGEELDMVEVGPLEIEPPEDSKQVERPALDPQPVGELDPLEDLTKTADELFNAEEAEKLLPPPGPQFGAGGISLWKGREPGERARLAIEAGGTPDSEAAVELGLAWLAKHQNANGSWSLDNFEHAGDCKGRCGDSGVTRSDVAGTGLALLPFLGAGYTHTQGKYQAGVRKALYWLAAQQRPSGDMMDGGNMYAHGIAALALCEAYGMTRDPELKGPAQRSLNFIVRAQHAAGGWRYRPGEIGDTSVMGWQLMALRSGQLAYLEVPDKVFEKADNFLDSVQVDRYGGRYTYLARQRGGEKATLTAVALLCRQFAGWGPTHEGMLAGCRWFLEEYSPSLAVPTPARRTVYPQEMYYWYYATQVMHHMGGDFWEEWNSKMRDLLVRSQEKDGHAAGSWAPHAGFDASGGRLYMTALAICSLEIYYRHMPLYRREAVER